MWQRIDDRQHTYDKPLLSRLLLLALFCASLLAYPVFAADSYFTRGVQLYSKADYKQAVAYFEQAVRDNPQDPNALYYDALCWHRLKDWPRATERYRQIVLAFPDSQAAMQAKAVLRTLDPSFMDGRSGRVAVSQSPQVSIDMDKLRQLLDPADLSHCPQQSRIYYRLSDTGAGIAFIVRAEIEGHPIDMLFDTGASLIVLGKNHLAALGLPPIPANQPPSGASVGVGSNEPLPFWTIKHRIKVGDMEIANCPISVQEHLDGTPLLGETFFKYFAYTIDYGAKSITLVRKDAQQPAGGSKLTAYDVPFEREGNELLVDGEINGHKCKMYFDTGAMVVVFSLPQIKELGIQIPEDATIGYSTGVGGTTRTWNFPVSFLKVGPIEKRDMMISVVEQQAMGHPLLGQTFYGGWQYTIDNNANVIRFVRR